MSQLKLVWELEIQNSIIDECKAKLTRLEDYSKLKDMGVRINKMELELNSIKNKIQEDNGQVTKLERALKEHDYTKNKVENDLYDGSITDLKQLEQLAVEKENTIEIIDGVESNILELIDTLEELESKYNIVKKEHNLLKKEIVEAQEEINKNIEDLKDKIHRAKLERKNITHQIDESILKRYEVTRVKRGRGIVLVSNDICGGCNVRIPTYLIHDLKAQTDIIYCESCGRLLYYTENYVQ